ncbi:MAG TPA: UDP-3-O-acyl-N-acetylglucosamine deacetylase, partial [Candidatus Obscuribacterales bacterium]
MLSEPKNVPLPTSPTSVLAPVPLSGPQQTLKAEFVCSGVGLHTGLPTQVRVLPADPGYGRVFVRVDLPGAPEIPASVAS